MNKNNNNNDKYKFIEKNFYNLRNQICSEFEAIENESKTNPNINLKPGKYRLEVNAEDYKVSVMELYIPPQDPDMSLIDYSTGLDGINRFSFTLEKGDGIISEDENTYLKMLNWCPPLIILFSLIGVWGSWVAYTLQSYKNAQIGAFFSVMAMGFLIVGPLLGIIALILLPKIKKNFTGHFKK